MCTAHFNRFVMFLQPVGCDLQLGSDLKIDLCGVCGGDGSSCSDSIYQWQYGGGIGGRLLSPCSASCDGGKWTVFNVQRGSGDHWPRKLWTQHFIIKPTFWPSNENSMLYWTFGIHVQWVTWSILIMFAVRTVSKCRS